MNGHRLNIPFALTLGLLALTGAVVMLGAPGAWGNQPSVAHAQGGSVRYVTSTGTDSGDCANPASPCYTVQYAVNRAGAGDVIKVAAGVYTGVQNVPSLNTTTFTATQIVVITKTLTVQGGYTTTNWATSYPITQPTTLDAQRQGRVLCIIGSISPIIEGLHITGGDAAGLGGTAWGEDVGGGVYVDQAAATICNNQIFNNVASSGGGVYLYLSPATISANIITANTADDGGGVAMHKSAAALVGNIVLTNTANSSGGGLYLDKSTATLNGNTVTANTADLGGGLALDYGSAILINNIVADNQAQTAGSGLYIIRSAPCLRHTTIARNIGGDGSGVHVTGGYGGDGHYYYSTAALTDTILVGHTVGITVAKNCTATLTATLWGAGAWANDNDVGGEGAIHRTHDVTGDPDFVNPDAGDYHLGSGSAAIDAGVDAGVTADVDGDPRPAAFGFDLGADERPGVCLRLHQAAWPLSLNPGDTVTYTLVITSVGAYTATNVWLTDTLPALQQVVGITTTQGSCTADVGWGGQATCNLGVMAPGNSICITLSAQVTTTLSVPIPYRMRNAAWVTATETTVVAHAATTLQDCHVRLNDSPTEYHFIQAAVDASTHPTDVVKVAGYCAGVIPRVGTAQMVYLDKTLTLQGGWNISFTQRNAIGYPTTLDAWGQGRVLYITGDVSPTIEGLRITGGDAAGLGGSGLSWGARDAGGGVYVLTATAILSGCQVISNTASFGGGICLLHSDAVLSGNVISGNSVRQYGGGLALMSSAATLNGNAVAGNTAEYGGGLYLYNSAAALKGNIVTANRGGGLYLYESPATLGGNTIVTNTTNRIGGGLYLVLSAAILDGNIVAGNVADDGGGLYLYRSPATLSRNTIAANHANVYGGGLFLTRSPAVLSGNTITANAAPLGCGGGLFLSSSAATLNSNTVTANVAGSGGGLDLLKSPATLVNNLVADNQASYQGSGLHIWGSSPRLLHNTIARNAGGDGNGIYVTDAWGIRSVVALTNTILVSHTVGLMVTAGNTVTLEATLWGTGTWANDTDWGGAGAIIAGTRNVWGDPAFVNPVIGDYHIGPGSAAWNAGVDAGVTTDIDGETRPDECFFDLGVDEFMTGLVCRKFYLPLVMRDATAR